MPLPLYPKWLGLRASTESIDAHRSYRTERVREKSWRWWGVRHPLYQTLLPWVHGSHSLNSCLAFTAVNSYVHPQAPHLYPGPSPMYPLPTQDSAGYSRPGKSQEACFRHQWVCLASLWLWACIISPFACACQSRWALLVPKTEGGTPVGRCMSWETREDQRALKLARAHCDDRK